MHSSVLEAAVQSVSVLYLSVYARKLLRLLADLSVLSRETVDSPMPERYSWPSSVFVLLQLRER